MLKADVRGGGGYHTNNPYNPGVPGFSSFALGWLLAP